jgi:hypothetical protein
LMRYPSQTIGHRRSIGLPSLQDRPIVYSGLDAPHIAYSAAPQRSSAVFSRPQFRARGQMEWQIKERQPAMPALFSLAVANTDVRAPAHIPMRTMRVNPCLWRSSRASLTTHSASHRPLRPRRHRDGPKPDVRRWTTARPTKSNRRPPLSALISAVAYNPQWFSSQLPSKATQQNPGLGRLIAESYGVDPLASPLKIPGRFDFFHWHRRSPPNEKASHEAGPSSRKASPSSLPLRATKPQGQQKKIGYSPWHESSPASRDILSPLKSICQ